MYGVTPVWCSKKATPKKIILLLNSSHKKTALFRWRSRTFGEILTTLVEMQPLFGHDQWSHLRDKTTLPVVISLSLFFSRNGFSSSLMTISLLISAAHPLGEWAGPLEQGLETCGFPDVAALQVPLSLTTGYAHGGWSNHIWRVPGFPSLIYTYLRTLKSDYNLPLHLWIKRKEHLKCSTWYLGGQVDI